MTESRIDQLLPCKREKREYDKANQEYWQTGTSIQMLVYSIKLTSGIFHKRHRIEHSNS